MCQKQTFRCRRQSYRRVAPFAVVISGWWATPRPRVCDDRRSIAVFRHSIKHCSLNSLLKKPTAPRRGISALVLGSETVKVLTHCKIPVLVYR